jgi:hypothetical protein
MTAATQVVTARTDDRYPGVWFSQSDTAALLRVYRLASDLTCECYEAGCTDADDNTHADTVTCLRCLILHAVLHSSPEVYAGLRANLPADHRANEEAPY